MFYQEHSHSDDITIEKQSWFIIKDGCFDVRSVYLKIVSIAFFRHIIQISANDFLDYISLINLKCTLCHRGFGKQGYQCQGKY